MRDDRITIPHLVKMKKDKRKITMLTAYDHPLALLVDRCGIDIILVGDSLGNVVLGYDSTVPVTMEEMIHHAKAVRRAVSHAFLIGDLPFMSYNISPREAVRNAGRFLKEAGCDAVKLEGGEETVDAVSRIVKAGIPVLGHLGLTPQTISKLGGFKVQGRDAKGARKIINSALALQEAGCFGIVLECIPDKVAGIISEKLDIFTLGIGAGPRCDGQVLVLHDLLGLYSGFKPKFVKQYADLSGDIQSAVTAFKNDIEEGRFPTKDFSFAMSDKEARKLNED